jgi:Spy/CpxP family protein refolding chaperone
MHNPIRTPHPAPRTLLALCVAAVLLFLTPGAQAQAPDGPGPDAIRARIHELEKKGAELKAAGDLDALAKVRAELDELRTQAARRRPAAEPAPQRREKLEHELGVLRERMADLKAAGKHDAALELGREAERIEIALRETPPVPERRRAAQRSDPDARPEPGAPGREEQARRREHVEIALEHLRAAGLPELAERVGQEFKRRGGAPAAPGRPPQANISPDAERLRAELNELRQAVRELKRRIEEVAADRR